MSPGQERGQPCPRETRSFEARGQGCPMPPGFGAPHPGGMADNSPTFQRWDHDNSESSPEGTTDTDSPQPSYSGLVVTNIKPNVEIETLGYYRLSLRDRQTCALS